MTPCCPPRRHRPHSALLYGVTGSGKTLVFLKLIERCLALGRRALVLVPEISLTPQMILRLKSRFGRRVAVQHSALNHTERLLQWQMIQDGGADIVVGTRSAVFARWKTSASSSSTRSRSTPTAPSPRPGTPPTRWPGSGGGERLPAPSGQRYPQHRELLRRPEWPHPARPAHPALRRQPAAQRPDRGYARRAGRGNPREISLAMEDAIRRNLDAGKQTILLLNRRGYQTMAQCDDCREVLKCPKCSVPMVYHKAAHKLLCHYCGTQLDPPPRPAPPAAASCSTGASAPRRPRRSWHSSSRRQSAADGPGLHRRKDAHEKLLAKFARHEYDIMVGRRWWPRASISRT